MTERKIVSFQVVTRSVGDHDRSLGMVTRQELFIFALDDAGRLSWLPSLNNKTWIDLPALDAQEPKP